MDKSLLSILCCPKTHQSLREATEQELERASRTVGAVEAGLVREDGLVLYPVRNGIPVLIVDQGILLEA